jgi:GH25 family lysozyme M1 (1,4-beta-N-acetylmuramidase)
MTEEFQDFTITEKPNRSGFVSTPSVKTKIARALASLVTTTNKYANYPLILDMSHWDGDVSQATFNAMKGYVDFIFFKCSEGLYADATFATNVDRAYNADIPCGAYHFFRSDPYKGCQLDSKKWFSTTTEKQFANFQYQLKNKWCFLTAIDVEAFKFLGDENQLSDLWISSPARYFTELVEAELSPNLKYTNKKYTSNVVYSAPWFIKQYAPSMETWLANHYGWTATYPFNSTVLTYDSWAEMKSNFYPPSSTSVSKMNCMERPLWQFSGDKVKVKGLNSCVDLNYFMGISTIQDGAPTKEAFYEWIGYTPSTGSSGSGTSGSIEELALPETVTVKTTGYRLRSGASTATTILRSMTKGDELIVLEDSGDWYRVSYTIDGWINKAGVE